MGKILEKSLSITVSKSKYVGKWEKFETELKLEKIPNVIVFIAIIFLTF